MRERRGGSVRGGSSRTNVSKDGVHGAYGSVNHDIVGDGRWGVVVIGN